MKRKVIIITQDDPFYLPGLLPEFLNDLSEKVDIVGAVILKASPFGVKKSFCAKIVSTFKIFGFKFFAFYTWMYIVNKCILRSKMSPIFEQSNIPLIKLDRSINHHESIKAIKNYAPNLMISILGNEVFKSSLLEVAPCLNLHTAALPKYRGLMPSFWVLKNKERFSAVSVFWVDEGIDSGPITVQNFFKVEGMTQRNLIKHSKKLGLEAILEAVEKIQRGDDSIIDNKDKDATYFSFPTKKDVIEFYQSGGRFI